MSANPTITERPSYLLYVREHSVADRVLAECEGPYGFGYEAAALDIASGLPAMTDDELANLWHRDYSEGYLDAYFANSTDSADH